jgi:rhodanese-related sulfurtransferase
VNIVYVILAIIVVFVIVTKFNNRGIKHMNVENAQELVKDLAVTILDVRSPEEFAQGHLQKARLIPVGEIADRIGELSLLKDKKILVYCHAGTRSAAASRILMKNGFTIVENLDGGITAWTARGNKIVNGN